MEAAGISGFFYFCINEVTHARHAVENAFSTRFRRTQSPPLQDREIQEENSGHRGGIFGIVENDRSSPQKEPTNVVIRPRYDGDPGFSVEGAHHI